MAGTSTNKQAMLMDRPLLVMRSLNTTSTPINTADPTGTTNAVLLVDSINGDGALIETISLIQRVSANVTPICFFLSNSASNVASDGHLLARVSFTATAQVAAQLEVSLPSLLAPVPHAAGGASIVDVPRHKGLRLGRGLALWAAAHVTAAVPDAPNVLVQGGWY